MSYVFKILAIMASALIMAACSGHKYSLYTNVSEYPYRHADFDYKYAWKTTATDQGLAIDGVMKNVRYAYIDSLQLTVTAMGKDKSVVARASTFPMPQFSKVGDVTHFNLLLRNMKPAPGDELKFLVHYKGNEGGNQGGVDWYSRFKVDAVTGSVIRPPARNPDEW